MVSYKVYIMRVLFSMLVVVLLSGCASGGIGLPGSPVWMMTASSQDKMNYFSKRCRSYGFKPLTPEFARCLMDTEDRLNKSSRESLQSLSPPTPTRTTCRKFGNTYNCSTL
jgi:hypothetical protein